MTTRGFPAYRIDPETNRDYVLDEAEALAYLTSLAGRTDLRSRGVRVSLLRVLGRLDEAQAEARAAYREAGRVGTPRQQLAAIIRLAHVRQWQQASADADKLFEQAIVRAEQLGDPFMTAFAHQHAGRNHVDQGRLLAAAEAFRTALRLREAHQAPADQLESTRQALGAVEAKLAG